MGNVHVGCDPEVFVVHNKSGRVVPSYGLIPGTKENPERIEDVFVSVDGVAAEFGIDPTDDEKTFVGRVKKGVLVLQDILGKDYSLRIAPSAYVDKEDLKGVPEAVLELGCAPDRDAYWGNVFPLDRKKIPEGFFFCGGHVHVGWDVNLDPDDEDVIKDARVAAIMMDQWLGAPLNHMDTNPQRARIYGTPGRFRATPYGLEYRTLSNSWIKDRKSAAYVFRAVQKGMGYLMRDTVKSLNPEIADENFISVKKKERPKDIIEDFNGHGSFIIYKKYSKLLRL